MTAVIAVTVGNSLDIEDPSMNPTMNPTMSPTAKVLLPLSLSNEATKLLVYALDCSRCFVEVELPFPFPFFSSTSSMIVVDSNGYIENDAKDVRIDVAWANLNPSLIGANMWTLETVNSFIVTWETVRLNNGGGFVNAQAFLYRNGDVELCWGEGELINSDISAGIIPVDDEYDAHPATGLPFDSQGTAVVWLSNQCRRLLDTETLPPQTLL